MYELPGGQGFVELVSNLDPAAKRGQGKGQVVLYFLGADRNSSLQPAPSSVTLAPSGGTPVNLDAKGDHFESPPTAKLGGRDFDGEIEATINGTPVKVPISAR